MKEWLVPLDALWEEGINFTPAKPEVKRTYTISFEAKKDILFPVSFYANHECDSILAARSEGM